ncbi:MAG: hypothetical protein RR246_02200 [Clostridia bacterium]
MFEKMKWKMIGMSILIAVTTGVITGAAYWACDNGKCLCKKARKAYKAIESKCEM